MSGDRPGGEGPGPALFAPGPAAGTWRATPDAQAHPPCRHDARSTSRAAAESMREAAPTIRETVRRFIDGRGGAEAMAGEVLMAPQLRTSTTSARFRELAQASAICDAGRTRPTTSGRQAVVWIAAGEGVGHG